MCCKTNVIPNRIDIQWTAAQTTITPYTADSFASVSGYLLNHASSTGPVTVRFLRGGAPLAFSLAANAGEYKAFTVLGVDTIQVISATEFASGELNILINLATPY